MSKVYLTVPVLTLFFVASLVVSATSMPVAYGATSLSTGNLIKTSSSPAIYLYGADAKRHLFPNSDTFWTYYDGSWSSLKHNGINVELITVTQEDFDNISLGDMLNVNPGASLVKFDNSSKIYTVFETNKLKRLNENELNELYRNDWQNKIAIIQSSFESIYEFSGGEFTDSDNDGISDSDELNVYLTDPNNSDSDGDGYNDGSEILTKKNPDGSGELFTRNPGNFTQFVDLDPEDSDGCLAGYQHLEGGGCVLNERSCSGSGYLGTQEWDGASWGNCVFEQCVPRTTLDDNGICVQDAIETQECSVTNGTGTQEWLDSSWGPCTNIVCDSGYHVENSTSCVSNSRTCSADNGFGYQEWNGSLWSECANFYGCEPGYSLLNKNGEMVCVRTDLTSTPSVLVVSTDIVVNIDAGNNGIVFNDGQDSLRLKYYDVDSNTISFIDDSSQTEAKQYVDSFYDKVAYKIKNVLYIDDISGGARQSIDSASQIYASFYDVSHYGERVVYTKEAPYSGNNSEIYTYDVQSGAISKVEGLSTSRKEDVAMSGDFIAWEDYRYVEGDWVNAIYLYDVKNGREKKLGVGISPRANDRYVVWTDRQAGKVWLYDYRLDESRIIGGSDSSVDMNSKYVVWISTSGGIRAYDLSRELKYLITPGSATGISPRLFSGLNYEHVNKVVWVDDGSIYMRSIE